MQNNQNTTKSSQNPKKYKFNRIVFGIFGGKCSVTSKSYRAYTQSSAIKFDDKLRNDSIKIENRPTPEETNQLKTHNGTSSDNVLANQLLFFTAKNEGVEIVWTL